MIHHLLLILDIFIGTFLAFAAIGLVAKMSDKNDEY